MPPDGRLGSINKNYKKQIMDEQKELNNEIRTENDRCLYVWWNDDKFYDNWTINIIYKNTLKTKRSHACRLAVQRG